MPAPAQEQVSWTNPPSRGLFDAPASDRLLAMRITRILSVPFRAAGRLVTGLARRLTGRR
jgi:hypothetical protein